MHREFDQTIKQLAAVDAGLYQGDPDGPMHALIGTLDSIAYGGIRNEDQLHALRAATGYLMAEDPEAPGGSVEEAMAAAMDEAVRRAGSPLQTALLTLVRHRLHGHRIDPLNA